MIARSDRYLVIHMDGMIETADAELMEQADTVESIMSGDIDVIRYNGESYERFDGETREWVVIE